MSRFNIYVLHRKLASVCVCVCIAPSRLPICFVGHIQMTRTSSGCRRAPVHPVIFVRSVLIGLRSTVHLVLDTLPSRFYDTQPFVRILNCPLTLL